MPLAMLLRRGAHYWSLATTAAMASIFNRLPSKKIQQHNLVGLLSHRFPILYLIDVDSTWTALSHIIRMKAFITDWGMPAFYRFNIYSNQSNEKLIPQC